MEYLDELLKYGKEAADDFPQLRDEVTEICWKTRSKVYREKGAGQASCSVAKAKIRSLIIELSFPS